MRSLKMIIRRKTCIQSSINLLYKSKKFSSSSVEIDSEIKGHPLDRFTITKYPLSDVLVHDDNGCLMLHALSNITYTDIDFSLKVVRYCDDMIPNLYSPPFYPGLLSVIRSAESRKCILTGDHGSGKSCFQFYYFTRLLNSELMGSLPPDHTGLIDAPKVVIRQVNKQMTVFDLDNSEAYLCEAHEDILNCFDPKISLYLYDPGKSKEIEPCILNTTIPTLVTASPSSMFLDKFKEHGGDMFYMPLQSEQALTGIAVDMLESQYLHPSIENQYSPDHIHSRFHEFGGIIGHVLPTCQVMLDGYRSERERALSDCDRKKILSIQNHRNPTEGYSILGMDVPTSGDDQYKTFSRGFVSEYVRGVILQKIAGISLQEKAAVLSADDEFGHKNPACNDLFKEMVAELLTSEKGVEWTVRTGLLCDSIESKVPTKWLPFEKRVERCDRGDTPRFTDMEENVLYFPSDLNFPLVHHMVKCGDELVAFRVIWNCSDRDRITSSTIKELKMRLEMPDVSKLKLFLIPSLSVADTIMIDLDASVPTLDSTSEEAASAEYLNLKYSVIKLPKGYYNAPPSP